MIRELVNVLVTLADATGAVFLLAWGGGEKRRKRGGNGRCGMRRTQGEKTERGEGGKERSRERKRRDVHKSNTTGVILGFALIFEHTRKSKLIKSKRKCSHVKSK